MISAVLSARVVCADDPFTFVIRLVVSLLRDLKKTHFGNKIWPNSIANNTNLSIHSQFCTYQHISL